MITTPQSVGRSRALLPEERRRRIADLIRGNGGVTVADLEAEFGVSAMTARRDLEALEQEGQARRTYGGAVLPELAGHEDSFQQRLERGVPAKERLARAAVALLAPDATVFLDSSTTAYYVAKRLVSDGPAVTVLTNSVPVMELLAAPSRTDSALIGVGGNLRKLTLSLVGPQAVHAIRAHFADFTFLSVKGVTSTGYLTDPDPLEAEVKRAMAEHSRQPVLLIDGSKLDRSALSVIAHLSNLALVVAADASEAALGSLAKTGVEVRRA